MTIQKKIAITASHRYLLEEALAKRRTFINGTYQCHYVVLDIKTSSIHSLRAYTLCYYSDECWHDWPAFTVQYSDILIDPEDGDVLWGKRMVWDATCPESVDEFLIDVCDDKQK